VPRIPRINPSPYTIGKSRRFYPAGLPIHRPITRSQTQSHNTMHMANPFNRKSINGLFFFFVNVVQILICYSQVHESFCNIALCKCEVDPTGKWSNIGVLFNQPHFNLVPKV
jgi:hypothetical protein